MALTKSTTDGLGRLLVVPGLGAGVAAAAEGPGRSSRCIDATRAPSCVARRAIDATPARRRGDSGALEMTWCTARLVSTQEMIDGFARDERRGSSEVRKRLLFAEDSNLVQETVVKEAENGARH